MTPEETIKQLAADITKSVSDKMGELSQWRAKHDESLAAVSDRVLKMRDGIIESDSCNAK